MRTILAIILTLSLLAGFFQPAGAASSSEMVEGLIPAAGQWARAILNSFGRKVAEVPELAPRLTPSPTVSANVLSAERWQEWPVLPKVGDRARAIYQDGLARGRNPRRFSKVGDCQVIRQYFLGVFDDDRVEWRLGGYYPSLALTINNFHGSFDRLSAAVRTGFNVASVLSPTFTFLDGCRKDETPLQCELRLWNPSIALVSMETWTKDRPTKDYEKYLRQIVDALIAEGVLPILATKADNLEGDHSINKSIARVASEYDLPLWNFWRAVQPLPRHGLDSDGFHLTNGASQMNNDESLQLGWNVRNLTGLQAIDAVWKAVIKKP